MHWKQLLKVLKEKKVEFLIWMLANLGGVAVSFAASSTIWLLYRDFPVFLFGPEVFLVMGTISLAVAGVSYLSIQRGPSWIPSPLLSLSWPFLAMGVYGFVVAMGVMKPTINGIQLWVIAVLIALLCWLWASLTWLHERGIATDYAQGEPHRPGASSTGLQQAAAQLPKIESGDNQ
ncbi:MAG: hypothetical protein Q7K03_06955 [Dehalococcoidia bacterium]|nr:hypothetical protein [Dehalococcoidia bacterium]